MLPPGVFLLYARSRSGATAQCHLGTHLRKLEAENYIRAKKVFAKRRPKTWYQITADGRRALERLLRQLEEMLTPSK